MDKFIWTDSLWVNTKGNIPMVVVFGRNVDNPKEVVQIGKKGFEPYFYVPMSEWRRTHPDDYNADCLSCYGDPIKRVVVETPSQIPVERNLYAETFEGDIPFDMRYLIDNGISYMFDRNLDPIETTQIGTPYIAYYDCEMYVHDGVIPNPNNPYHPLSSICVSNNYTDDIVLFMVKPTGMDYIDMDSVNNNIPFDTTIHMVICSNERIMLRKFADYIASENFDVISGWNSKGFDDPYVVNRAQRLTVDIAHLSRINMYKPTPNRWAGRQLLDMMKYFKDWSKPMGQMPTYNLKYISKRFIDFEYENYGPRIAELIDTNEWNTFIEYSINDVVALREIDKKVNLYQFYEGLRATLGVKLSDLLSRTKMIDTLLMRRGIKPMPTKVYGEHDDNSGKPKEKGYKGATVLSPPVGLHSDVGVLDYKALYPTIIIAYDISPDIDKMIPKVIVELLEMRNKLKRKRLAGTATPYEIVAETAIKYVVNSFYGYMGAVFARMYDKKLAAKITAEGRDLAAVGKAYADSVGYQTVYGDTDSIFVKGIKSVEEGTQLMDEINAELIQWSIKHGVKEEYAPVIEYEKRYKRIMFKGKAGNRKKRRAKKTVKIEAAKKRYAGWIVWKDGHDVDKMDLVGLETKRSDAAQITKDVMVDFFEMVVKENDVAGASKMVRNVYKNMEKGLIPIQQCGLPKGVANRSVTTGVNGAWVRGMNNAADQLGLMFTTDMKPMLLYCKRPFKEICIDTETEELPKEIVIDWQKMAEKTIRNKMEPLLMSLGVSWIEATKGQKSLFDF